MRLLLLCSILLLTACQQLTGVQHTETNCDTQWRDLYVVTPNPKTHGITTTHHRSCNQHEIDSLIYVAEHS